MSFRLVNNKVNPPLYVSFKFESYYSRAFTTKKENAMLFRDMPKANGFKKRNCLDDFDIEFTEECILEAPHKLLAFSL